MMKPQITGSNTQEIRISAVVWNGQLTFIVLHVDKLNVITESRIDQSESCLRQGVRQVAELFVAPTVEAGQVWTSTTLRVQLDRGNAQFDKPREQRLAHVGVAIEGLVLDDRRQLVVIPNHNPPLQSIPTRQIGVLEQQRNERLDLEDLRSLLHQDGVISETHVHEVATTEGCVSASHRYHLGFLHQQVARPLRPRPHQFERAELVQAREDRVQVLEAGARHAHVFQQTAALGVCVGRRGNSVVSTECMR